MHSKTLLVAAVAAVGLAGNAMAGFSASTGVDLYSYTAPGTAAAPVVGGVFDVANQALQSYTPDTAADPQIAPGDLPNVLFKLHLTVTAVNNVTGAVQTSGTYGITYGPGNISISSGTASLYLTPAFSGFDVVTGQLAQTAGPANPAFRDLAYGNNGNLVLQGGYLDTLGGNIALTLRQNAVVAPEPTSLAALAGVSTLALRRRRA